MKALLYHALVPCLATILCLASGCASSSTLPAMPAWSVDSVDSVVSNEALPAAAAFGLDDQDEMRVPQEHEDAMRVPKPEEEEEEIWPARGLYLGAALITSQPLGDFDGDTALLGPTDVILVPDLDVGGGGGVYVSYRWYMNEIQLQYSVTAHDGEVPSSTAEHDTTFYDLDVNWRHYFWAKSPLQPYGLLGMGWSRADIENGSVDNTPPPPPFANYQDAELLDGINVNLGIGVALYSLPWLVVYGQAMYRFVRFESSDGADGRLDNNGDIDGDSWNISAGAALRILPGRKSGRD